MGVIVFFEKLGRDKKSGVNSRMTRSEEGEEG